jgi:hypothetical protein
MATIARRYFSDMATEVNYRLGNRGETGFSTRVQNWITAAYYRIATMFHHYEMDVDAPLLFVPSGATYAVLPSECFLLVSVDLLTGAGVWKRTLKQIDPRALFAKSSTTANEPTECTRYGARVYFPDPTDAAYDLRLRYIKMPAAPDFTASAAYSQLSWVWDEAIMELATANASAAVWRPDVGSAYMQSLAAWMAQQTQPQLNEEPQADRPTRNIENRPPGGKQG